MRILVKVLGTLAVTVLLGYPLWAPDWGTGILGEVWAFGFPGGLIAVATFFGLVALYCRTLQRSLTLVRTEARAAAPASVWWMFAIPYNFVEDFFIVGNVARSLRADGRADAGRARLWAALGYTWCAAQVLSLLPGHVGYVGGGLALVAWGSHWIFTARLNRALAASPGG